MSGDVRLAAERLVLPDWAGYPGDGMEAVGQAVADAATVARAWLAANPADSDEPITPEWLASVGFDPADSFTHDLYPVRMELFADRSGEAIIGGVIFPHMNTRRDVRRLFAGLKMHLGG
jgi:hypothetical protein